MNPGDAFHINGEGFDGHLWFIISDTSIPDEVVIVSVTGHRSWKGDDCELYVGDHPFITKQSVIYYDDAQVVTLEDLQAWKKQGILTPHIPASKELLQRMRLGAAKTLRLPSFARTILQQQGVI